MKRQLFCWRFLDFSLEWGMRKIIEEAGRIIKNGGVIVCPTDTVYGLICDATNKKAVEKIFKIKKRPKSKPLPLFAKDLKMAKKLAEIDRNQEKFLKKVWPGKITVVLKSTRLRPPIGGTSARQRKTIALRVPKHKVISYLLSVIGRPLAQTSANISGQPASNNIKDILEQFKGKKHQPDLIVRYSVSNKSKPSKIIDLTKKPYKILRG